MPNVPAFWLEWEPVFILVKLCKILFRNVLGCAPFFCLMVGMWAVFIQLPLCSVSAWISGDTIRYLFTVRICWNYPCTFIYGTLHNSIAVSRTLKFDMGHSRAYRLWFGKNQFEGPCFGHKRAIFWPFLGKGDYGIHPELWNLAWTIHGNIDYD